jgi:diguanylate cyclase (GGDEF)-like protein
MEITQLETGRLCWSYKIIFILIGLLFIKVFELIILNRIIHWYWKIPLNRTEEFIYIIITALILIPFLIIVMKQRIRLEGAEARYKELAFYDQLTGLSNRRYFEEKLSHSLMNLEKERNTGVVMFLDFDGFKQVNDTYGHEVGDLLLKEMSVRLLACVGKEDVVSRFAGDEFLIFLPKADKPLVLKIGKRIMAEINKPFAIHDHQILTSTSIGMAFFPEHGNEVNTLIKNADIAMYKAKLQGKNTFSIFDYRLPSPPYSL